VDTTKGLALIGVLIIFAMWVSLWENVWQASVEPTRANVYSILAKLYPCLGERIYDSRTPWPLAVGELDAGGLKGIIWLDRSVLTSKP
jgi:hypothetical protein